MLAGSKAIRAKGTPAPAAACNIRLTPTPLDITIIEDGQIAVQTTSTP